MRVAPPHPNYAPDVLGEWGSPTVMMAARETQYGYHWILTEQTDAFSKLLGAQAGRLILFALVLEFA